MISRRDFLKSSAGLVGLLAAGQGCKNHHLSIGPLKIVFLEEPETPWEDVDPYIDNSLENGFSFDFRDLKGQGTAFGNLVEIDNELYALDAHGYTFTQRFNDQEKQFTITSLRSSPRGFALDLMENVSSLVFEKAQEMKSINVNGKQYSIALDSIVLPENREGFFIPSYVIINGNPLSIQQAGRLEDLFVALGLKTYHEKGIVELFLSHRYFRSCTDSGDDTWFTGLEHIIEGSDHLTKKINANDYNGNIQEDAYFRIDARQDREKKVFILSAADKIRIPDADPLTYPSIPFLYPPLSFHSLPLSYSIKNDIEIRVEDKKKKIIYQTSEENNDLERRFLFSFSPPLETRIEIPKREMSVLQDFFNREFENAGKRYMFRYAAFDATKIPKTSQPSSLGIFYPPMNGFLAEILEEPEELILSEGETKSVNFQGETYRISSKPFEIAPVPADPDIRAVFGEDTLVEGKGFDYLLEVEKNGVKEEGKIKIFAHGYKNRILDINVDPDITNPQKFFISRNKFSSTLDFDDKRFSGLKKVIIPDYNGTVVILSPIDDGVNVGFRREYAHAGRTLYKQVTLANRFNGRIQSSEDEFTGFRAEVEFGLESYEGSEKKPDTTAYRIRPTSGFNYADQIKNGFILRIKSLEKILRSYINR